MAQAKKGRPVSEDSMKERIFIRIDEETKEKLRKCKETLHTTTSDVVRKGIARMYDDLKK